MPTGHIVPTLHGKTFFKSSVKGRNQTYLERMDMVNVADWEELEEMLGHSMETIIRPALATAR